MRRLPAVAAPVLGVAATAFAVVGTPATSMAATTHVKAGHHAPAARTTRVASVTRKATVARKAAHAASSTSSYTVRSGDTLSSIARHFYQDTGYWTAVYQANQHAIHYADSIMPGQSLTIPAKPATAPAAPSTLSAPAPVQQPVQQAAPVQQAPVQQSEPTASADTSTSGDSGFQQCVISHESGGDAQVTNSSGHYGLYQFSPSTWAEYGGNPSDFGNASASEQNQVFDNAMAQGGQSNWSSYDGC